MKKITLTALAAVLALGLLAACGSDGSSSQGSSSQSASQSSSSQTSQPSSSQPDSSASTSSESSSVSDPEQDAHDVNAIAATLAEAANLGEALPYPDELDLRAGGISTDNIEAFSGLTSKLSSQNGGTVIVIKANTGAAADVAADLEAYRDASLGNPDYTEFETARTNTQNARIETFGDYVVYAVSATGHEGGWDALDAAIAAAFA